MASDKVAAQYAKAFIEMVKDAEKARHTVKELLAFAETMQSHPELKHVLTTDIFKEEQRRGVVEDVAKRLGVAPETTRFLVVLSDGKRLRWTDAVAKKINTLLLNSLNVVPLEVVSPEELGSDQKKKVEAKFQNILGKKVEATYSVNPEIMGGLKVTAGGRTFDGSLSGWLDHMEESLMAAQ
jgi:F-type H+-transporting ATPase subunit delta